MSRLKQAVIYVVMHEFEDFARLHFDAAIGMRLRSKDRAGIRSLTS